MSYSWEKDPALPGFHPASAWDLKHGRDFVPMLRDRKEATDDFGYAVGMDAGYPAAGDPRAPLVCFKVSDLQADGKAASALAKLGNTLGMIDPRLHLLPLRRRMLAQPDSAGVLPAVGEVPAAKATAPKALVGIIDHAINVVHDRFRNGNASRVAHAWYQGADAPGGACLPFGREWSAAELTDLIAAHGGSDERILRAMGMLDKRRAGEDPLHFRHSHGTHVLDLAAGEDPASDAAKAANILAVILPPVVARESSGSILPVFLLQGFDYLLRRARAVSKTAPLYVNVSLGVSGGPRGGKSVIEAGVEALIAEHRAKGGGPVTFVSPSGNRNLAEGHAWGDETLQVTWRVQPGDRTSNHIDCRIAGSGPVTLSLTPPDGAKTTVALNEGDAQRLMQDGNVVGRAVLDCPEPDRLHLGLSLAATEPVDSGRRPARAGAWTLEVSAAGGAEIDAWILRDDSPPGYSDGGRQSYFSHPGYERYKHRRPFGDVETEDPIPPGVVERSGALNALSTGAGAVTIGGYRHRDSLRLGEAIPSLYSAGPLRDARTINRGESVTVSAVSDRSRVLSGVLGASTLSGGTNPMNGTSVAAPQAVRLLAEADAPPADPAAYLMGLVDRNIPTEADPGPDPTRVSTGRRIGAGGLRPKDRIVR